MMRCRLLPRIAVFVIATIVPKNASSQAAAAPRPEGPLDIAAQLDRAGETAKARALLKTVVDSASQPSAKAQANRATALSYAFDADCKNTIKYEQRVVDYWKTREQAEPQNAFFQQGEIANEAARVCIDSGDLAMAEKWYRMGYELGMKEPEPRTHSASLWEYRLAHALGRIAARRGNKAEAQRQIAIARRALDADTAIARQQERYFPYLTGYVALYTNDLAAAEADLTKAVSIRGNERDPFMRYLLALTYDKQGRVADARASYQQAYDLATAHNPPAAFVRRNTRGKVKP